MKLTAYLLVFFCFAGNPALTAADCITDSAGNTTCAAQIFSPTTLQELQDVVKLAILDGVQIRAFGGLHSNIDDVSVGDANYLINMNYLNKIFEVDRQKRQVRVEGGVNLHRLSQELAKIGLELLTQPGPYDATVGGMCANGVHESGLVGSLSNSIIEIEIVDGFGNLRRISETENSEWLPAARLSLGVLGPVYSVKFQCYPATKRRVFAKATNLAAILANLEENLLRNDAFQFLYDPLSQAALYQTFNKTNANEDNTSNRDYGHYLPNSSVVGQLNSVVFPLLPTPAFAPISESIVTGGTADITEFFYKSYSYFHSNAISRGRIVELSIEAQYLEPALKDLSAIVNQYKNAGKDFVCFSEVRYVSDGRLMFLSPTNRPSWNIGFLVIFPDSSPDAINILRDFTFVMQNKYGGRPQWGNNPEFLTFDQLLKIYGQDRVSSFTHVRRLFDPHGIFYTPYFQQRLGPL